jgi:Glycosyltransferase WbsX
MSTGAEVTLDTVDTSPAVRPKLVAFVLPQFHPTPENDEWWGKGFTEWTNVAKSVPLFPGHVQPHLPADLGFYDLRLPEARAAQAALAQQYGIDAFCYYHYWFHGRRLLHAPIDAVLASGEPDHPFCFCWANEPWSRTWLGDERELLIGQKYSREDDRAHAAWLVKAFSDPRYLKTDDGRAIFMIYRPSHMDEPAATIEIIREAALREGLPDPYIVLSDGHEAGADLRGKYGADMTLRFEPQLGALPQSTFEVSWWRRLILNYQHSGMLSATLRLYDYARSRAMMRAIESKGPAIRTVLVRWDNSPRRGERGIIMTGATPEAFGRELQRELARPDWNSSGTGLLFINAFNEWAEGNHLEPDQEHGLAYLEQLRIALQSHAQRHGLDRAPRREMQRLERGA